MSTISSNRVAPIALKRNEGEALWFMGVLATIKSSAKTTDGKVAVIEHLAPLGSGSPLHVHRREDEWFYVMEGELAFWVGGEIIKAPAGSFVYGPRDIPHTFQVTSEKARFLLVTEPAGFEDFMRAAGEPARDPSPSPRRQELAARPGADVGHRCRVWARDPGTPRHPHLKHARQPMPPRSVGAALSPAADPPASVRCCAEGRSPRHRPPVDSAFTRVPGRRDLSLGMPFTAVFALKRARGGSNSTCPGEWPGGVSPPGSLRTVRDSLPSYGSRHPVDGNQPSPTSACPNGSSLAVGRQASPGDPCPSLQLHYRTTPLSLSPVGRPTASKAVAAQVYLPPHAAVRSSASPIIAAWSNASSGRVSA